MVKVGNIFNNVFWTLLGENAKNTYMYAEDNKEGTK